MKYDMDAHDAPRFRRIGGAAGIGFALLILGANLIAVPAGLPTAGAPVATVVEFFRTESLSVGVSSAFGPAAWLLAVVFGAGVLTAARPQEREHGEAWSIVGFAGILLQNAAFMVVIAARIALTSLEGRDEAAYGVIWALHEAVFTLNGTFLATALVGLSIAGWRTAVIKSWLAILGLVSSALLFSSSVLTPLIVDGLPSAGLLGLVGWLLWVIWLIAYGAVLLRRPAAT